MEGPWPGKHIHTYSKIDPHSGIPLVKLHVVLTRDSLVNKGRKERNLKSQKANTEPLYTEVINTGHISREGEQLRPQIQREEEGTKRD